MCVYIYIYMYTHIVSIIIVISYIYIYTRSDGSEGRTSLRSLTQRRSVGGLQFKSAIHRAYHVSRLSNSTKMSKLNSKGKHDLGIASKQRS